jgi:hypothetical protein
MPGVAGGAQAVGAVHPERDKSGRHAWRVTIDTNGGMNQEIHMDTSKATHTPDERTTAPLYPYGMTVHITYTDHTDVQYGSHGCPATRGLAADLGLGDDANDRRYNGRKCLLTGKYPVS